MFFYLCAKILICFTNKTYILWNDVCATQNLMHSVFLITCGQYLWFCFQFQKPSNNPIWHDKILTRTDLSKQVTMLSPPLGDMKNIYHFFFAFIIFITTKLGRNIDQHKIALRCR